MRIFFLLAVLLCPALAVADDARESSVLELTAQQADGCRFITTVSAKSGWGGLAANKGIRNATKATLKKAANAGATHVVWVDVHGGFMPGVSARAYDCRSQAESLAKSAEELRAREEAEETKRRERAEALIAEEGARIANIKSAGPVHAYPMLASHRYHVCELVADSFLNVETKNYKELFEQGLDSIQMCARREEAALSDEVRLALASASSRAVEHIKDLHAYTIASIRALTNFHQSVIEARQARAQRSASIDERTIRLELEL